MTTIVIDFKNKKIACDELGTRTNNVVKSGIFNFLSKPEDTLDYVDRQQKVYYNEEYNCYILGTGRLSSLIEFVNGFPLDVPKCKGDVVIVVVYNKGSHLQVVEYRSKNHKKFFMNKWKWDISTHVKDRGFFTYGSGSEYAMGALHVGVGAEKAIQIASQCDPGTGHKVHVYQVGEKNGC